MKNYLLSVSRQFAILVLLGAVFSGVGHAENIRGRVAGTLGFNGATLNFLPEQLVAVNFDVNSNLMNGIELQLDIPGELQRYQNSFALMVFRNVSPKPALDNRSYSGTRAYMRLLPSRNTTFIRIPFESNHGITGDALTDVLQVPVNSNEFPLLVTVLPVMKGIPDNAFTSELGVRISPIWKNEGTITLRITNPSGNPDEIISVSIDGKAAEIDTPVTVSAGMHRIRVRSSHAPAAEKNIAVEPGQKLVVDWILDYRPPEITISKPLGSSILLDGEEIVSSSPAVVVESKPGSHVITYRMGEWEISRRFTLLPGAKLAIDLLVEIDIVEYGESTGNEFGAGEGS